MCSVNDEKEEIMSRVFCIERQDVESPNSTKEVMEEDDINKLDFVKSEMLSSGKLFVRELVAQDRLNLLSVIKKENEDTEQELVEIKKEVDIIKKETEDMQQELFEIKKEIDGEDVTWQLVHIKPEAVVKEERIENNLLNTISIKDENKIVINELVSICKSEASANKGDVKTEREDAKKEILKLIKVKEEEQNLIRELVSAYENKQAEKDDSVRTEYLDERKGLLRPAYTKEGRKRKRKMTFYVTVCKSVLPPDSGVMTFSVDTRNKVVENKQTVRSGVLDETMQIDTVKDLVLHLVNNELNNIGVAAKQVDIRKCINKEKKDIPTKQGDIREYLMKEKDKQNSEGDRGGIMKAFVKPVQTDTILRPGVSILKERDKWSSEAVRDRIVKHFVMPGEINTILQQSGTILKEKDKQSNEVDRDGIVKERVKPVEINTTLRKRPSVLKEVDRNGIVKEFVKPVEIDTILIESATELKETDKQNSETGKHGIVKEFVKPKCFRILSGSATILKERDEQSSEPVGGGVLKEFVKPVEIDTILSESDTTFQSTRKPAADKVMDVEEKRSSATNNQSDEVTEPIECTDLCDIDEAASSAIDDLCTPENTSDVMDIEFVDCSEKQSTDGVNLTPQASETCSQINSWETTTAIVHHENSLFMRQYNSDFMRLPHRLTATRGVVNVQNTDTKSFLWSILAAVYPAKHGYRTSKLAKSIDKIDMSGIEYPVSVKSIDKFEELNPDISVHVLGYEEEVYPIRMSACKGRQKQVCLLLITGKSYNHYCAVTNISRLLSHLYATNNKSYFCYYCLRRFRAERKQKQHSLECEKSPLDIEAVFKNLKCKKHTPKGYMSNECGRKRN